MKHTDCIIAGGGFPGIYAAWRLAKSGKKVCLLEASDSLGGVMRSRQWNGYWLDNGTHNLDIRSEHAYAFYSDILQDEFSILKNHDWASTTDTTYTLGFEMPDFSIDNVPLALTALSEISDLQKQTSYLPEECNQTFLEWYEASYGPSLCAAIHPILKKITGGHTHLISSAGKNTLSMLLRPKLADDSTMILCKESSEFLNARLGVTRHCGDTRFAGDIKAARFAYPAQHGLGGFCQRATVRLQELGVDLQFNSAVEAIESDSTSITVKTAQEHVSGDSLLWTLPDHLLSKITGIADTSVTKLLPVGYCIYAFEVPSAAVIGPDYLHDYSTQRLPYRYSRPGVYSQQQPNKNLTVVMAEVPAQPSDQASLMESSMLDRIWEDCKTSGYIQTDCEYHDACCWNIPVAFTLPTSEWATEHARIKQQRETLHPRIAHIDTSSRGRAAFIKYFNEQLSVTLQ